MPPESQGQGRCSAAQARCNQRTSAWRVPGIRVGSRHSSIEGRSNPLVWPPWSAARGQRRTPASRWEETRHGNSASVLHATGAKSAQAGSFYTIRTLVSRLFHLVLIGWAVLKTGPIHDLHDRTAGREE